MIIPTDPPYAVIAECEAHIAAMSEWLDAHPVRPDWPRGQIQARADRERSLRMWRDKLAMINRTVAATK